LERSVSDIVRTYAILTGVWNFYDSFKLILGSSRFCRPLAKKNGYQRFGKNTLLPSSPFNLKFQGDTPLAIFRSHLTECMALQSSIILHIFHLFIYLTQPSGMGNEPRNLCQRPSACHVSRVCDIPSGARTSVETTYQIIDLFHLPTLMHNSFIH
jgi:hypothetical protein